MSTIHKTPLAIPTTEPKIESTHTISKFLNIHRNRTPNQEEAITIGKKIRKNPKGENQI